MTKPNEGASLGQFRIATWFADSENIHIEDGNVKGRWARNAKLERFYGLPRTNLLEIFLNHPNNNEAILKFTRQFGPLEWEHEATSPQLGREWGFSLKRWRAYHQNLRFWWAEFWKKETIENPLGPRPGTETSGRTEWHHETLDGEEFAFLDGHYEFLAKNLKRFLTLKMVSTPLNRFRVCTKYYEDEKNQQSIVQITEPCETPYFIAADLKQIYCSPKCATWAQHQWKKRWWEKVGKPRREKGRRKRSSIQKTKGKSKRGKQ